MGIGILSLVLVAFERCDLRCWNEEEIKEKVVVLRELERAVIYNE
jgi:hypothetical protein